MLTFVSVKTTQSEIDSRFRATIENISLFLNSRNHFHKINL
jgi:hypothetical protein